MIPRLIGSLNRSGFYNSIARSTRAHPSSCFSTTLPLPSEGGPEKQKPSQSSEPAGGKPDAELTVAEPERQDLRSAPVGPINVKVNWRDPERIRRIEDEFELEPEPVFVPQPVKQEWISRVPVEYHGTLPDKFDNDTQWLPIYRLPYVTRFRVLIRAKLYLTGITATTIVFKVYGALAAGHLTFGGSHVLLLSAISLSGLIYTGDFFRRMACQIYVTEDLQYVRFCRFTFFGNRRDLVLPREQVIPLPELNPSYRNAIMKVRFSMPEDINLEHDNYEFYEHGLRLIIKYGGVLDRERFRAAMGNVFARLGE